MATMPMLAGVGLLMVCCSSSSVMMMMGGGEETPDAGAGAGADDSGADDSGADDSGADDSGADDSGAGADDSCDETLSGEKDAGYRGCQAQTVTGKTCQKWNIQTPHKHKKVLGEKGVGDHNYCRNPDGEDTIWCYTTDPDKRWDYCEPL